MFRGIDLADAPQAGRRKNSSHPLSQGEILVRRDSFVKSEPSRGKAREPHRFALVFPIELTADAVAGVTRHVAGK